jgi:hypothetical protein
MLPAGLPATTGWQPVLRRSSPRFRSLVGPWRRPRDRGLLLRTQIQSEVVKTFGEFVSALRRNEHARRVRYYDSLTAAALALDAALVLRQAERWASVSL